jgi:integration host factor subunit alpha
MANKTLTKADLTDQLCGVLGLSRVEVLAFIDSFFETIAKRLEEGEEVKLSGFGNFIPIDKAARQGRNPKTGAPVMITSRRVVTFRAGNKLKDRIQEQGKGHEKQEDNDDS